MRNVERKSALFVGGMSAAVIFCQSQAWADPSAKTSTSRNNDGSTRITVDVKRGVPAAAIKDVHLCVAKTTHSDAGEKTDAGDPMSRNYSNPAGAAPPAAGQPGPVPTPALPGGFTYKGLVENAGPGQNESSWCITWTDPNGALGADFSFVVDYQGGKGDVGLAKKENVFLTGGGGDTVDPKDILNGGGAATKKKGEKGHMPIAAFNRSDILISSERDRTPAQPVR